MLPLQTLVSQLNLEQQLWVERRLQSVVAFDSKSLLVFNALLAGFTSEEIKVENNLSNENYPLHERPIYNCICELYGIVPSSAKDQLLSEIFYAIHENDSYSSNTEKANKLESLFHEMKKHQIEQVSSKLLFNLYKLHLGSPLQAVYHHLYVKYKKIDMINQQAISFFESLNRKLSLYSEDNSNTELIKEMISDYKIIRTLYIKNENRTLNAFLNVSKLILVELCDQMQLLKEGNETRRELIQSCEVLINGLPFGISRHFLKNIFTSILEGNRKVSKNQNTICDAHNFLFELKEKEDEFNPDFTLNRNSLYVSKALSSARMLTRRTVSSILIPRDSWSISSTKLIG